MSYKTYRVHSYKRRLITGVYIEACSERAAQEQFAFLLGKKITNTHPPILIKES